MSSGAPRMIVIFFPVFSSKTSAAAYLRAESNGRRESPLIPDGRDEFATASAARPVALPPPGGEQKDDAAAISRKTPARLLISPG